MRVQDALRDQLSKLTQHDSETTRQLEVRPPHPARLRAGCTAPLSTLPSNIPVWTFDSLHVVNAAQAVLADGRQLRAAVDALTAEAGPLRAAVRWVWCGVGV